MARIGGVNFPTRALIDQQRMWQIRNMIEDKNNRLVAEQSPHIRQTVESKVPPVINVRSPQKPFQTWKKT